MELLGRLATKICSNASYCYSQKPMGQFNTTRTPTPPTLTLSSQAIASLASHTAGVHVAMGLSAFSSCLNPSVERLAQMKKAPVNHKEAFACTVANLDTLLENVPLPVATRPLNRS